MGVGMAEFIEKEVVTLDDFDLYCHYVAGTSSLQLQPAPTPCDVNSRLTVLVIMRCLVIKR